MDFLQKSRNFYHGGAEFFLFFSQCLRGSVVQNDLLFVAIYLCKRSNDFDESHIRQVQEHELPPVAHLHP